MRCRSFAFLALTAVSLAIAAPACSGGGDDDDDDGGPGPQVSPSPDPNPLAGSDLESEPNDLPAQATAVVPSNGAFAFHGRCAVTGDRDWFSFAVTPQSYLVALTWDERRYMPDHVANDLDIFVQDSSGQLAKNDDIALNDGPVDSPAEVVAVVGSSWTIRVLVDCFQSDEDLFYQGELAPGS